MTLAFASVTALLMATSHAGAEPGERQARDARLFTTYQGMLDEDPYQPYALRRLLEVSHVKGGLVGLVELYEARVAKDARSVTGWIVLGHLFGASDRHDDAARAYSTASKLAPRAWRPQRSRARLFRKIERWEDALGAYDTALDRARQKSDRIELWQEAADAALEGKQLARAQTYFAAMNAAAPRKHFLHMEAAATLGRRGYPRASLAAWLVVQERVGRTLKHLVVVWRQVATLQEELGDLDAAEATWRRGLDALTTSHWARPAFLEGLVSVHRRRDALPKLVEELANGRTNDRATQLVIAHLHEEMGRDDQALVWLKRVLSRNKRDVTTRLRLIGILERTGPTEALIAQHEALIKVARGEPRHELNLAALYFQKGMTKKGFALVDRLAGRYRTDPGVHQRIVDLTMRYGGDQERPRVERAYRTLMRLEPREEGHVISLGEYWWSTGDRTKARQTWRRLRSMGASAGAGLLTLAEVLGDHGLVTDARAAFVAALKAEPNNPRIVRTYALFLEQQKFLSEALALWQRILTLDDRTTKVAEARRHIVQLWQRAGQSSRQEASLRARFQATPPELEAGFFLVEVLLERRSYDEAQAVLERLRAL
ncbi:MAG: hypothetical protein QF464_09160, partial [Myxococcota bacterium]|nr:hypothetical protein [Myxococcota bacterium]